jgi:hypothetical protein
MDPISPQPPVIMLEPPHRHFFNKKFGITTLILILLAGSAYGAIWYWQNRQAPIVSPTPSVTASSQLYRNDQYGFSIALPEGWKGYTVMQNKWEGRNVTTDFVVEHGPIMVVRHPQWTPINTREDMPVMVFTLEQWDQVKSEKMAVGAAPLPPSILGQNSKYVLALPARYNFDYKTGWEEVDQLVHALKTFEPK